MSKLVLLIYNKFDVPLLVLESQLEDIKNNVYKYLVQLHHYLSSRMRFRTFQKESVILVDMALLVHNLRMQINLSGNHNYEIFYR